MLILATPVGRTRDFAQANDAFTRVNFNQQKGRLFVVAATAANGSGGINGNGDGNGFDMGDLHVRKCSETLSNAVLQMSMGGEDWTIMAEL